MDLPLRNILTRHTRNLDFCPAILTPSGPWKTNSSPSGRTNSPKPRLSLLDSGPCAPARSASSTTRGKNRRILATQLHPQHAQPLPLCPARSIASHRVAPRQLQALPPTGRSLRRSLRQDRRPPVRIAPRRPSGRRLIQSQELGTLKLLE